ncbi:exosome complex exonuclease RRP45 [Verticillium alfalfae VaMs.102]|uniref:Exosome complex exonuclease RRP45 n=1 Tax=Verticillium alfalfae (strain VaMs.102 / ATCC MYA-4576 / FGSC 10136) TaxID=526221 RepID=C9SPB5_VERA1|nr:exosome complex exonuclease RRP45 [Verticillium alfalfae VaMs.102]EEY20630.1 exosome complex exonuclease RRP45 [Verticillium alfalfae VaMs.102]
MPREAEPSVNEKEFILKALHEGVRLDGRPFDQYRTIDISFGDEYGVVDVSLGKTSSPPSSRPWRRRTWSRASPPTRRCCCRGCSRRRSAAPAPSTWSRSASSPAPKVWSVRADVHVVSHDGNIVDAACLAAVAALRHFRKPDAQVEGEDLTVFTPAEREPVPLGWLHSPFCVTFAHFAAKDDSSPDHDGGDVTLLDPDWREEQLRVASCTISLNKLGEVCQVSKLGGDAVEATTLLQCAARRGPQGQGAVGPGRQDAGRRRQEERQGRPDG